MSAGDGHMGSGPTHQARVDLLAAVPALAGVPSRALADLAAQLVEARLPAGRPAPLERGRDDRLAVLVRGRVDLTIAGPSGPVPLGELGPGELLRVEAVLAPDAPLLTVTARTPLVVLQLDPARLDALLTRQPALGAALASEAAAWRRLALLARAGLVPGDRLGEWRRLAGRLGASVVPAGATILGAGASTDCCQLLLAGHAEGAPSGAAGAPPTSLGAGDLVGAVALVSGGPQPETVRAVDDCELLTLRRADLAEVLLDAAVAARLRERARLRGRPRRVTGIAASQRAGRDGEAVVTLKDPHAGRYYRLSAAGWLVWQRCDGSHTIGDLTRIYLRETGAFAPETVVALVGDLAAAGFLDDGTAHLRGPAPAPDRTAVRRARRLVEWYVPLRGVDPALDRLYAAGVRFLFTWPAQLLFLALAVAGIGTFLAAWARAGTPFPGATGGAALFLLLPALLASIVLHEAGHAFTTKAFGHEVRSVGVGWYWLAPVAYVDTSDMWLAGRWPRLAVNGAGLYVNLTLAGAAALAAPHCPAPALAAALWQFALTSYTLVLLALNPLLETDGYFLLIDLLERPNLRPRALAWLGRGLPRALRAGDGATLRRHWLEALYGLAALGYLAAATWGSVALYRALAADWLARYVGLSFAMGLAWLAAALLAVVTLVAVIGDLRGADATASGA